LLVDTKVKEEVDKGEKDVEEEEQEQEEKEREVKEVWVEEARAAEHPPASPRHCCRDSSPSSSVTA